MLSWVANLPCDSRERLRSKEQELAMLGISWASTRFMTLRSPAKSRSRGNDAGRPAKSRQESLRRLVVAYGFLISHPLSDT